MIGLTARPITGKQFRPSVSGTCWSGSADCGSGDPVRRELAAAAVVRELHVYGSEAGLVESEGDWQHRGYGRKLMECAEEMARKAGYRKLAVISGIGAREYYREKLGYRDDGPYVSKRL